MSEGTNSERILQNNTLLQSNNSKLDAALLKANNLPNASGSTEAPIKLFETQEQMQADTTAKENDLAVVYRNEVQDAKVDSIFSKATFPQTVVLDTALTDYVEVSYRAMDGSMFDCYGNLSSSRFRIDCYSENGQARIEYTSSNGLTYTRSRLEGEGVSGDTVDFGVEIYYERPEYWNDAIGKFIQIGGNYFEGLYKYGTYTTDDFRAYDVENYTYNATSNTLTVIELDKRVKRADVDNATSALRELLNITDWGYAVSVSKDYTKIILCVAGNSETAIDEGSLFLTNNKLYYGRNTDVTHYVRMFEYNINTKQIVQVSLPTETLTFYHTSSKSNTAYRLDAYPIGNCMWNNQFERVILNYYEDNTESRTLDSYHNVLVYNEITYKIAPTQLTLQNSNELLLDKITYGKNGIIAGDGSIAEPNSIFTDVPAMLYGRIQLEYDTMEPKVLTDDNKTIDRNIYCIPSKSDGTPLLDISNITNLSNMFSSCVNLITIPEYNTSNATNTGWMFNGCKQLKSIPILNTGNVTSMSAMFQNCENLINIPTLDTSNVIGMGNMFSSCKNLESVPLLNTSNVTDMSYMLQNCSKLVNIPEFITSKVTNMGGMFANCTSLVSVPLLDTSKVTSLLNMFSKCPNLSDESLNNILAMCAHAVNYTSTKTLKYVGLTQEQTEKCKTLSNYSAFTSAGWTTGY